MKLSGNKGRNVVEERNLAWGNYHELWRLDLGLVEVTYLFSLFQKDFSVSAQTAKAKGREIFLGHMCR